MNSAQRPLHIVKERIKADFYGSPLYKWINVYRYWRMRFGLNSKYASKNLPNLKKNYSKKAGQSWNILHYERIVDPDKSLLPISERSYVRPSIFEIHCKVLSREFNVISLYDLISSLEKREMPPDGSIVITINNGYQDAFLNATKLLLQYGLTATWTAPLAYIGSSALLEETMLALILKIHSEKQIKLTRLTSLADQEWALIAAEMQDEIPGPSTIYPLYSIIISKSVDERRLIFKEIESNLSEMQLEIPKIEDHMKWADLISLNKAGFEIIPGIYTQSVATELSHHNLSQEINKSVELLGVHALPWRNIVKLPHGIFNQTVLEEFPGLGVTWCLGETFGAISNGSSNIAQVLNSKVIFDHKTHSRELFLDQILEGN